MLLLKKSKVSMMERLQFNKLADGFTIYFKEYLLFEHKQNDPCFKLGKGTARYKEHHGHFKIKEKELTEIPLQNFELISDEKDKLEIDFKNSEYERLKLIILVENDNITLKFDCSNPDFNRFWMKIRATPNEAIYGLGEQFSEVNFRGKEVPLWVEEQGVGRGDPPITGDWYTTYHPQPTFVSSENYFCHCESSSYARFDFTNKNFHELYIWSVPEEIIIGKYESTLKTVSNLSKLLGLQPKLYSGSLSARW